MHPFEKVMLRYGTLVYVKDRNDPVPQLYATCPDTQAGRLVASAISLTYDIPLEDENGVIL
jgi:hypothetical protein